MPTPPFDPARLPPALAAYLLAHPAERDEVARVWARRALAARRLLAAARECLAVRDQLDDRQAGELADRLEERARGLWDYDPAGDAEARA